MTFLQAAEALRMLRLAVVEGGDFKLTEAAAVLRAARPMSARSLWRRQPSSPNAQHQLGVLCAVLFAHDDNRQVFSLENRA